MRTLSIAVLASFGLAGCVAVPLYDAPYGYSAPPAAYGPPAVVVRPYFYGGYYNGGRYRGGPRRHW